MKSIILSLLVALIILPTCNTNGKNNLSKDRPNVILIMTDDQGYGDLACHGNPYINTPNIDQLASEGIRLDDYHACPYCVPSRASLLSGHFADRAGIHNYENPHWFIAKNEKLLSEMFQEAGYKTGMFGKWHLGDAYPFGAEYRGFDEVLRHYGGAIGVLNDYWDNCYVNDTYYHNGNPEKQEGYCTDVFFNEAMSYIEESAQQDDPFFVYISTNAPHGPLICPPEYAEPYLEGETKDIARFYGMITNIDDNVGKLRKFLQLKGLEENTILIFTTDNGGYTGVNLYNAGMRGRKNTPYEGGHRVPFILHWPKGGFDKEQRINTLTANIDVAPTLLDLCNIEVPEGVDFDGTSLRPLIEKGEHPDWPDRILMVDSQYKGLEKWSTTAVMSQRWRLVNGNELYDMDKDPGQENNVFSEYPEVVQRLSSFYDTLWDELDPVFRNIEEIELGCKGKEPVMLSYHDCMDRHFFWYQGGIRNPEKFIDSPGSDSRHAYWPVQVLNEGNYHIELCRWPKEANAAIHQDLPAGDLVYGRPGQRSIPGRGFKAVQAQLTIGDQQYKVAVDQADVSAMFNVLLRKGTQKLSAKFTDEEGRSLDAFFVYVERAN
jgi:arylsulfatase A-like enzyme